MIPKNGSRETWLGTRVYGQEAQRGMHRERACGMIRKDLLEVRRQMRGPAEPAVRRDRVLY